MPLVLALSSAISVLGACGGSGGGGGSPAIDTPVNGVPTDDGLRFELAEDAVLDGVLSDPARPDPASTEPFSQVSTPEHGTVELRDGGLRFRYTPEADFNGIDGFDYATFDERVLRATIDVTPTPDAPVLASPPPLMAESGAPFRLQLSASDPDEEALRFESRGLPGWLDLDPFLGTLTGTPGEDDVGRHEGIVFVVTDPTGRRDESSSLVLEVIESETRMLSLDISGFPATLDARSRRVVTVLPASVDIDGITLVAESGPGVTVRVEEREIVLEADDVSAVTEVEIVLELVDRLGERRRTRVPLTVLPLSESGAGRTLLGSRDGRGLHLVVLGDGYRTIDQALLIEDARALIERMRLDPGTGRHIDAFNVHVIESISVDSGIDDGPLENTRDTLFDSHYGCADILRLICTDQVKLFERAMSDYADVREIVLFINDARSGGSGTNGGGVAIAARDEPDIALHEMGHSLAGLGDEYVDDDLLPTLASDFEEGQFPNISAFTAAVDVPWAHWIDDPANPPRAPGESGVGLFEGGLYRAEGIFRPTFTSRMREFEQPFGPVNAERWVLGVYRAANVVRAFEPFEQRLEIVAGESQRFSVTPFFPPDVQSIEWTLNGERVLQVEEGRVFEISPLPGVYRVGLTVRDISGLIRIEPPHSGILEWEWELTVR